MDTPDAGIMPSVLSRFGLQRVFRCDGMRFELPRRRGYNRMSWALRHGEYERQEIEVATQGLDRSRPLLEFGSGAGVVSCSLNRLLEDPSAHHAYEMDGGLLAVNRRNRAHNDARYTLYHAALAPGLNSVALQGSGAWMAQQAGPGNDVATVSLREAVSAFEGPVNVIMDVEGMERDVVLQEAEVLRRHVAFFSAELHPRLYGAAGAVAIIRRLQDLGFRLETATGDCYGFRNTGLDASG